MMLLYLPFLVPAHVVTQIFTDKVRYGVEKWAWQNHLDQDTVITNAKNANEAFATNPLKRITSTQTPRLASDFVSMKK